MHIKKEALFFLTKIIDIGYVVVIYFIIGVSLAKLTDILFGTYDVEAEQKKSFFRVCAEIIGMIWFNLIVFYVVRNVVEWIPSPLHGVHGYDHYRLKELSGAAILGATYVFFQTNLRNKLVDLKARILLSGDVVDSL